MVWHTQAEGAKMTIQDFEQIQIGVVVATCDRPRLLSERSIPSILNQSRAPDFIVIVDDSSSAENIKKNNDYIKSLRLQKTTVKIIRNIHRNSSNSPMLICSLKCLPKTRTLWLLEVIIEYILNIELAA